jgi:Fic family protein
MAHVIQYEVPTAWINYNKGAVADDLLNAKAAILALRAIPFQRRWVKALQEIQLKMEVAGTSQIEGADFAANELEVAIKAQTPDELLTRSQKQANAAVQTYKEIAKLADDVPITVDLISHVHRLIVTDCDDDHCPPGVMRKADQNVTFGVPKHRGATGGEQCEQALARLTTEFLTTYQAHDPLVQALALHYHFAAMHPFADGNGRTARVLEALALQRAGLKDSLFIAMSNYYYEEKRTYLSTLAAVRAADHDLTPFLMFGLKGIRLQTERLTASLRNAVLKELFRSLVHDLFVRLESTRKRVIVKRQLMVLNRLLDRDGAVEFSQLVDEVTPYYASRKNAMFAIVRDLNRLGALGAITIRQVDADVPKKRQYLIAVDLNWPSTITESEFFAKLANLPKSKTYGFLTAT